jgi:serine/threonine protein phosphatase PrpC
MASEKRAAQWQVVGRSVRGASHERSGMPNQDAIHWLPQSGAGTPLILALADGHGSAKHFRSQVGARLAVETAAEVVSDFLAGQSGGGNPSAIKRAAEEWLPGAIVRRWLEAVTEHFGANGLSEVEHDLLRAGSGRAATALGTVAGSSLALVYGATVLVAAVTESFAIFLQLGDGEILCVSDQGEVSRPLPSDERLFANETTSLCAPEAWRDFRVCFQMISHTPPAIILLSTDGYPNSFRDESGFLKVGSDILEMIRADGDLRSVSENIETWLIDSTRAGSGDDVTLGIICRDDAARGAGRRRGSSE